MKSLEIRCYKAARPSQEYVKRMIRESKEKLNKVILRSNEQI